MTILKRAFFGFILFLLVLVSAMVFLANDLALLVKFANIIQPGRIQAQNLEGSLFSHIYFDTLEYQDNSIVIRLTQGDIRWKVMAWRHPDVVLTRVHIDTLKVVTKKTNVQPSTTAGFESYKIRLPVSRLTLQSLKINHMLVDSHAANNLIAHGVYTPERWAIPQLQAEYDKVTVSLDAHGQTYGMFPISLNLSAKPMMGAVPNAAQGQLSLVGDVSRYKWQGSLTGPTPLKSSGTLRILQGKPVITSEISWGPNRLNVEGDFPNQLQFNLSIPKPDILHPSLSGLQTSILATGDLHTNQGNITIKVLPGKYQLPKESGISFIHFEGGVLRLKLNPDALIATGKLTLDNDKVMDVDLHFPQFKLSNNMADQTIEGNINLRIQSLSFLNKVTKEVENIQGQVLAALTISGKLKHPEVQGTLTLSKAELYLPAWDLRLKPIEATLKSHDNQWDAIGLLTAPNGATLTIKGQGKLSPDLSGELTLVGDNFPALKTEEYDLTLSPRLTMHLQPNTYLITGKIAIPEGKIKLASFTNTIKVTSDVVLVKDKPSTPDWTSTTQMDVQVETGPNVYLDVQGLQGYVEGTLQVKQTPERPLSAIGELAVRKGTYKAYNQDLTVDHGKLLFSGGPIANPIISLRAERKFNQSTNLKNTDQLFDFNATNLQTIDFGHHLVVGVEVSGHLNEPKLSLFSVPATLSQADILSMLLIGKPASQASGAGGDLLLTAMSSMNLNSGNKGAQLLSEIKETLGIDLDLKNGSQFNSKSNQNDTSTGVVVGKALSPRLYLSYNRGLFIEDSNVLTLKYLLNKYFSLQVSGSDSGNGIDFLYTNHP